MRFTLLKCFVNVAVKAALPLEGFAFRAGALFAQPFLQDFHKRGSTPARLVESRGALPRSSGTQIASFDVMAKPAAPAQTEETRKHYFEIVERFDTATLVTRPSSGRLHGRPLSVAGRDDDGTLWFVTSERSPKVAEILADPRALVTMQSSNRWVVLEGTAALVRDRAKIEELFSIGQKIWFEDENDPDIVLVRFTPDVAEYWDNAGAQGVRFAFEALKALARGRPLEDRGDERAHGKVTL